MNILILSSGTRCLIIRYFKEAIKGIGRVVAADCNPLAPALYEADKRVIVPHITDENYLETVLSVCRDEQIDGVLSLIDPELSILAQNEEKFIEIGTTVVGSSYELCERALDKMLMYHWLSDHGYRCARSYSDRAQFFEDVSKGVIDYPVFVKPVRGSASVAINKVYDRETIELLFNHNDNLMIQEYLDGDEIGVDCYIDMISGEPVSIFLKRKILMRAGETDKAESFADSALTDFITRFVRESGWRGQIDIDVFCVNGDYYISEVNPRFGGGYPFAHECGCNHMRMIVNNLLGNVNPVMTGKYDLEKYMCKYSEIRVVNR